MGIAFGGLGHKGVTGNKAYEMESNFIGHEERIPRF
jgi:hypothetical protein